MSGDPTKSTSVLFGRKPRRSPWLRFSLSNPAIQVVLFSFFMVSLVLLMTRTIDLVGGHVTERNVGEPAQADIKATRDFTHVEKDTEATQQKRDEIAKAIPKVYDHYADKEPARRESIGLAFDEIREILQSAEMEKQRAKIDQPDADPDAGANPDNIDPQPAEAEVQLTPDERVHIAETSRVQFDQALQVIVADDHFASLARDGFSPVAELALTRITSSLLSRHIVPNRRLLELEGRRGITIRTIRDGQPAGAKRRFDFAEFVDANEIQDEITRIAPELLASIHDDELRDAIIGIATKIIQPNTLYNEKETEIARTTAMNEVPDLVFQKPFKKGQNIVDRGHIITPQHIRIIREMDGKQDTRYSRAQVVVGTVVISLILMALLFIFARRYLPRFEPRPKDLVLVGTTILFVILSQQGLGQLFESLGSNWTAEELGIVRWGIPIALGAMLVRLVLTTEIAIVYAILVALFLGIAAEESLTYGIYAFIASTAAAASVSRVSHRMDLLVAGLATGAIAALAAVAITLLEGVDDITIYLGAAAAAFGGGLAAGVLVSAILPVVEWIFNYTTDIKLLELADLNHPALRELFMRAPGSYNHSIMVGNLCKEAAEAIGANPLLARVGAYYHDLGKGKNPHYFAENQRVGHNPHDKLKPNMSALILKAHVKDGLEIARQYGLPREIQDFIAQHHGTSLIAYFYHKAKSLEDPSIPEVDEKDYRYPGPKPQTRETAICMLADGIEAASRAMPEPTHDRLAGLVQKMINKAFADGQLDECDLTLKDLNAIARAFIHVLCSMYHHRPQYPSDKKERSRTSGNHPIAQPARTRSSDVHKRPPQAAPTTQPPRNHETGTGLALFEDRLGDNDPDVLALSAASSSDSAVPAILNSSFETAPHEAIPRRPSATFTDNLDPNTDHDPLETAPHAADPDPESPDGDDDLEPTDRPEPTDPTLDQPLRRLGLS